MRSIRPGRDCTGRQTVNLTPTAIKVIESILSKGDRAEVIPGPKESAKVIHIKRKVAYTEPEKDGSKR